MDWVFSVAFSPDGTTIASGSFDNTARLWNAQTGEHLRVLDDHIDRVRSVAFSPDGSMLASGSYDGTVRLWNPKTGDLLRMLDVSVGDWVMSVSFSPVGDLLASGSHDSTVRLWNAETGEELQSLEGHMDWIDSVVFSPTGMTLASGSGDSTVRVWNVETGEELQSLEEHTDWVRSVAFSPDGSTLASGGCDNTVRLWTLAPKTVETPSSQPEHGETTDPAILIYWTQPFQGILRATIDGEDEQNTVMTGLLSFPYDIVLDRAGGKMYWTVLTPDEEVIIQHANWDGSDVQDISVGLVEPGKIALDTAGGKLYWTETAGGTIGRANLDGSAAEDIITEVEASSVALDTAGGKLYWTEPKTRKIRCSNLDGSEAEDLVTSNELGSPFDIALDVAGGKMYWAYLEGDIITDTPTGGKIQRANLDGSQVEDLANTSVGVPWDIALDIAGKKMYWSYLEWDSDADLPFRNGKIQRANLDGSGVEDIVTEMLFPSFGITLDVSHPMSARVPQDANGDGTVNILDLVLVAQHLHETGEHVADVNGDGVVNILDLVAVAGALQPPAVPSAHGASMLTPSTIQDWLTQAEMMGLADAVSRRGIAVLEYLLATLTPKETALLPNYPNPFNPETWIPYHLAKDANVTLSIYDTQGALVRRLELGHRFAGHYTQRGRAAYWNGRNHSGEAVASGIYFYQLATANPDMNSASFRQLRRMTVVK